MNLRPKLSLPDFETTADQILQRGRHSMAECRAEQKVIGDQDLSKISLKSSLRALDSLRFIAGCNHSRIYLLMSVHPQKEIREAAQVIQQEWQTYDIELTYDEKLYSVVKAFAAKQSSSKAEKLEPEEEKLLAESLRSYRRLGFELAPEKRNEVKILFQELHRIESSFSKNIQEYKDEIFVLPNELIGMDANFIASLTKKETGEVSLGLDYPTFLPIMEFCENESIRARLLERKYKTAEVSNRSQLNKMVELRMQIARQLGYKSWNHFVMEERMAKDPARVDAFLKELEGQLRRSAAKDFADLAALKAEHTTNPKAEFKAWDFYFYSSLRKKRLFAVDSQEIRHYFPLPQLLDGMFGVFRDLFGIKIIEEKAGSFYSWHPELRLFKVEDEDASGLGYFYLDLHPREGKYNHAAAFGLTGGRLLENGEYQRPVKAMVCNFPRAQGNEPALIPHREVETLFHEFGHILHGILTQAKYAQFSGTSVAWDFVEAPSQILENWAWDYQSLKRFAKDWRDSSKVIPEDLVIKMQAAKKAGNVLHYLRQVSLARADVTIHGEIAPCDAIEATNEVLSRIFLPVPPKTAFAAGWGHMVGYAGGYYGYAWADVMAADLFSRFKNEGILNASLGRQLRREIYEPGGSRDENVSLEAFLGRPLSNTAFFEDLGVAAG